MVRHRAANGNGGYSSDDGSSPRSLLGPRGGGGGGAGRRRADGSGDGTNTSTTTTANATANASGGTWSKSHLFVLVGGVLMGYVLLPVLLLEVQIGDYVDNLPDLDRLSMTKRQQQQGSSNVPINNHPYNQQAEEYAALAGNHNYHLRPISSAGGATIHAARTLDAASGLRADNNKNAAAAVGAKPDITMTMSAVEQRLWENREILSRQSVPTRTTPYVMKTAILPDHHRKKILVTGGAGFVGSHLVDKLMMEGQEVIVADNFFTGQKKNIAHWLHHPNFSLVVHDITEQLTIECDQIYHLACPASPPHYQYNPVKTIKTSTMGTLNMLGLAKRVRARMLLTSTSEIYGDPQVHPQPESYWGNVNTIGPRACYDEGKRVAETMMYSYKNQNAVDVRVARIFNTFGPRMHPNDGRVVSNFIIQSLQNKDITIYGDGEQTRSFQYVSDLVEGLYKLMNGSYDLPVNLGNPEEYTVKAFAEYIQKMTQSDSKIIFLPKSQDDPSQRKPDITVAKEQLGWEPAVKVEQGLKKTIEYFQSVLEEAGEIIPTGPGAAKPEA